MYCPGCGLEELQATQFCRACGTDLRAVRTSLERPESITSALSAREEIGRALAQKIREIENARDLKRVGEHVLPQIEKFLESHEEKRLRRLRNGTIAALVGLGVGIPALIFAAGINNDDFRTFLGFVVVFSAVAFTGGIGLVLNGLLFSKPVKEMEDRAADARLQNLLDAGYAPPPIRASEAGPPFRSPTTSNLAPASGSSVTEGTTHHLKTDR